MQAIYEFLIWHNDAILYGLFAFCMLVLLPGSMKIIVDEWRGRKR